MPPPKRVAAPAVFDLADAPTALPAMSPTDVHAYLTGRKGKSSHSLLSGDPAELGQVQEASNKLNFLSRTGAGLDEAARMIAGIGGRSSIGTEDADRPVREYLQRAAMGGQQAAAAKAARLADPTSPESKAAQDRIRKASPGLLSEEALASVSAADLPALVKLAQEGASLAERKRATDESLRSREAEAERDRQVRTILQGGSQAFTATQNAIDRAVQAERDANKTKLELLLAQLRSSEHKQEKEDERKEKLAEREVGGFTFDPEHPPNATAANVMAKAKTSYDAIMANLRQLKKDFAEYGTEVSDKTAAGSRMVSARKAITDQVRILSDMGVPNASDYVMLALQIPDPVGLGPTFTPNAAINEKFAELERQMDVTLSATAKALKYSPIAVGPSAVMPPSGSTQPAAPPRATPAGGAAPAPQRPSPSLPMPPGKLKVSNGKETLIIDASDLKAAEADGYRRVP